jgi:peptidoglycan/LPS O-acetylase OafA/YrhL
MDQRLEVRPLTGLRAVAALLVFIFHIQIRWPFLHTDFLANLIGEGAVGMSVFFVLSGFVLTYQYGGQNVPYREYLINRVARIYPVYALAAILSLPWIGIAFHHGAFAKGVGQLVTLVLANAIAIQAWFPQFFALWNDGASWSISVEVFCYALLPLILMGIYRMEERRLWIVMLVAYAASVLPGITFIVFDGSPGIFYSMPVFRLPEFFLGVCTCIVARRHSAQPRFAGAIASALAIGLIAYLGTRSMSGSLYVTHNWLVMPTVVVAIYYLAKGNGLFARAIGSRPMVWLGKISYCIYSLQILIILPLFYHHGAIVERWTILADNRALLFASLTLLIAASALCHHLIEEPSRRWIRRRAGGTSAAAREPRKILA